MISRARPFERCIELVCLILPLQQQVLVSREVGRDSHIKLPENEFVVLLDVVKIERGGEPLDTRVCLQCVCELGAK
ncbi:MAG TPA: hypothetical protein PLY87_31470, partial [Planctomycetaceae bacterium]|nr:hypothetical protein [Planctomycetaceae bacterium]